MSPSDQKGLNDFAKRMVKRARSLDRNLQKAIREIAAVALTELVYTTPVGSGKDPHPGKARGGWVVELNSKPAPREDNFLDQSGDATVAQGLVEIRQVDDMSDVIHIENHVPYISELNRGSSAQAPAGFVDKALMKARASMRIRSFLSDAETSGKGTKA